jgi:predicted transposase/invertase (TIGR01784 family)
MVNQTQDLFDKVFKKLITSSPRGVIHLINGLFNINYPLDSPVEYLSTEFIGERLHPRRSDTMIKIGNGPIYNLEVQIKEDKEMVIRVFEYGFMRSRFTQILSREKIRLTFPIPKIIYLEGGKKIPGVITLEMEFPDKSIHKYKVGTFKIQEHQPEELFRDKMILLLPFCILKLRHKVKRAKTKEKLRSLATELKDQIDELTKLTLKSGQAKILEKEDINTIQSLMERLFKELYTGYTELEGVDSMLQEEIKTYAEELEERLTLQAEERLAQAEERENQNRLESARRLKARGLPSEHIAVDLGLPLEVVEKL